MLNRIPIGNIVFLDIETVSQFSSYSELSPAFQELWAIKGEQISRDSKISAAESYERAGIYAEFGKIICISVGIFSGSEFRIKSFYGDDERILLDEFFQLLNRHYDQPSEHLLCGHNIKEFDIPYICRRALVQGLQLPAILDVNGKKPWEVNHLDTMQLWKFGDFKSYTSLNLLANVFDIPTPKDDISGADVGRVYWTEKDLARIAKYCQKDVLTVAQLLRKMRYEPLIQESQIVFVN